MKNKLVLAALIIIVATVGCRAVKVSDVTISQDPATGQIVVGGTIENTDSGATATVSVEPGQNPQVSISSDSFPAVHFAFDSAAIRPGEMLLLPLAADALQHNKQVAILIKGHCDERGTKEYNQALGRQRAENVKNFLISCGVAAGRISTISYGKERPLCTDKTESCYQRNRRAEFVIKY